MTAGTLTRWALSGGYWLCPGLDPIAATDAGDGYAPKPTAQNTGPAAGVTLTTHSGDYTLSSGSISGLHITGDLILAGSDVSVTDCQVDGAIFPNGGSSGHYPVLTNQTLTRVSCSGVWATGGDRLVFDACHFGSSETTFMQLIGETSGGNYMELSNVTIKNCLFDNLIDSENTGKHTEALHISDVHTALIQNCVFDFGQDADADTKAQISEAVNIDNYENSSSDVTFTDNELYGGGYYQIGFNPTGTSYFTNNAFHGYAAGSVSFPHGASANPFTQSGNTLDGQPFTLTN